MAKLGWLKYLQPLIDKIFYNSVESLSDLDYAHLDNWYEGDRPEMTPNHFWLLCSCLYAVSFHSALTPENQKEARQRFLSLLDEHDLYHCTKEFMSSTYTPVYIDGWCTTYKLAVDNEDQEVRTRLNRWLRRERALQYLHLTHHPQHGRVSLRSGCRSGDEYGISFQAIANMLHDGTTDKLNFTTHNHWNQKWFEAARKVRSLIDQEYINPVPFLDVSEAVRALQETGLGTWYPWAIKVAQTGALSGYTAFKPTYASKHVYGVDTFNTKNKVFRSWEDWLQYWGRASVPYEWHLETNREGLTIVAKPKENKPTEPSVEEMIRALYKVYILGEPRG